MPDTALYPNAPHRPLFDIDKELKKAMQYYQAGELYAAEAVCRKILEIHPNHSESLHLSGIIAHLTGRDETALHLIKKAIQNTSGISAYHNNLGEILRRQGKSAEAISSFQQALHLNPDDAKAHNNMGIAFKEQGRLDEAISSFQKALALKPDLAEALNNMGIAFKEKGEFDEAISCYQNALKLKPNLAEAYNNIGIAFKEKGDSDQAISSFYQSLRLKPDDAQACCNLFDQLQKTCAWQELGSLSVRLDDLTKKSLDAGTKTAESPFLNLTRCADPSLNFAVAKSWAFDIEQTVTEMNVILAPESTVHHSRNLFSHQQKITIGYLSNDFRNHVIAHQMLGLFDIHNREDFEIFCYSLAEDDGSHYRRQIEQDCDHFVDLSSLSHADAAKRISDDQIQILVDLMGYTSGSKSEICAFRPAPIQISYLGFLGTTGAAFFDYIITDKIVTPPDQADYYSENFVYMPHCFQVNNNAQPISDKAWEKSDFGLPDEGFVFCSFNNTYKLEPVIFDTWMNILRQTRDSVLWLLWENEAAERNLKQEAEKRGVAPEQLVFAKALPLDEHLARIRLADLALDTRAYNGGATTSNALWAGIPVITMQGSHFVSRMSSSILEAIGLPELITRNSDAYMRLAVHLAHSPDKLGAIRIRLEKNRLTEPLFDTPGFVRNLENAYKEMRNIFLAGERPRQIELGINP